MISRSDLAPPAGDSSAAGTDAGQRHRARGLARAALALCVTGCSLITDPFATNESSGDPYPIPVNVEGGAVLVTSSEPGGVSRASVLDVLSPVSILDPGPNGAARAKLRALYLIGAAVDGARAVARALLEGQIIEVHPCREATCVVGDDSVTNSFAMLLGADLFAGDALRLELGAKRMWLLPDISGSSSQRTKLCEAVFPEPFRGGGTLLVGGTELPYVGRRITVAGCAAFKESLGADQGANLLLAVSTAIGPTLISESAYERYRRARGAQTGTAPPALEALPESSVVVPSGEISGRLGSLSTLHLIGESSNRGACNDAYWYQHLLGCGCPTADCNDAATRCGAPAQVELDAPVSILIISDTEPLLVGLRTELHPDSPDLDGVIGTKLLSLLQVDIDYPNNRLLVHCAADNCVAHPDLPNLDAETCARASECAAVTSSTCAQPATGASPRPRNTPPT